MTEWLDRAVEVNTTGPTRGATIIDRRPWYEPSGKPLTHVPMRVDSDRFVADLLNALR
jgi:inosine-uridine nucleoside N-ribohydrolase